MPSLSSVSHVVYNILKGDNYAHIWTLWYAAIQFDQYYFWRWCLYFNVFQPSLSKSNTHRYVDLCLGLQIDSLINTSVFVPIHDDFITIALNLRYRWWNLQKFITFTTTTTTRTNIPQNCVLFCLFLYKFEYYAFQICVAVLIVVHL